MDHSFRDQTTCPSNWLHRFNETHPGKRNPVSFRKNCRPHNELNNRQRWQWSRCPSAHLGKPGTNTVPTLKTNKQNKTHNFVSSFVFLVRPWLSQDQNNSRRGWLRRNHTWKIGPSRFLASTMADVLRRNPIENHGSHGLHRRTLSVCPWHAINFNRHRMVAKTLLQPLHSSHPICICLDVNFHTRLVRIGSSLTNRAVTIRDPMQITGGNLVNLQLVQRYGGPSRQNVLTEWKLGHCASLSKLIFQNALVCSKSFRHGNNAANPSVARIKKLRQLKISDQITTSATAMTTATVYSHKKKASYSIVTKQKASSVPRSCSKNLQTTLCFT